MAHEIPLRGSSSPPIADYALLSDCEVCALVAPSGNVEWMRLRRMEGPSVFSAILDRYAGGAGRSLLSAIGGRSAGRFRVGPADRTVPAARRYVPGAMVLQTTWGTPT